MAYFDKKNGALILEPPAVRAELAPLPRVAYLEHDRTLIMDRGEEGKVRKLTVNMAKVMKTLPSEESLTAEDVGEALGKRYSDVLLWLRRLYYMGLVVLASRGTVPSTTTRSLWRLSAEGKRILKVFKPDPPHPDFSY